MDRRQFMLTAGASVAAPYTFAARSPEAGVTDAEILLGQSAVLSGPLSAGALAMQGGAKFAFEEANAKGGVAGRKLRLLALDDAFDAAKAQANYEALIKEHQVLACVLGVGGVTTLAGLPLLKEANMPLVGATAVVDSAREKSQGVAYFTRATQQRESDSLVQHLQILGIRKVAVAHIATPGGQEVLGQLKEAAAKQGLQFMGSAAIAPDGSNAADAGKTVGALQAQATIMFLSGPAGAVFIQSALASGAAPAFYGMSILAGDVTAKLLGDQSRGLAISQVTPYPWDAANADANRYRKGCEKAQVPVGYHSYEGYIAGRVMVDALKQTGRDLTRARLHASLRALKTRVGGIDIDFSGGQSTGSRFVELVRVRPDGKFVR
jgi:branched-chain amino acid transport system substrate-binding protein